MDIEPDVDALNFTVDLAAMAASLNGSSAIYRRQCA